MEKSFKFSFLFILINLVSLVLGYGQTDSSTTVKMLESSVQEVMKLPVESREGQKIFSASKSLENIFNAPLSSYVITREDMYRAGVTNIAEAMRLVPGVIVRETTNGNYDIHWRGLDNIVPYSDLINTAAKGILVMINGRAIYDHFQGGAFWETIPIDIHDVEQMEVVFGASSTLYGANAVLGVLNIITRSEYNQNINATANLQYGNFNTLLANMAITQLSNNQKWTFTTSANFQQRDRFDSKYYMFSKKAYIDTNIVQFPSPSNALQKYGVNATIAYKPNSRLWMSLNFGVEDSKVHKVFLNSAIASLTYSLSKSYYAHYQVTLGNLKGQFSNSFGEREFKGTLKPYNFNIWESSLEYDYKNIKNLLITPALFFRKVAYKDAQKPGQGLLNSGDDWRTIDNYAVSLKLDYKIKEKIRLILAGRIDKFNYPNDLNYSYQGIITYTPHKNHLLRFVVGKANAGSYIASTFLNLASTNPFTAAGPNFNKLVVDISGSKDLKLLNQRMFELGYRVKIADKFNLDIAYFSSITTDYNAVIQYGLTFSTPPIVRSKRVVENIPLRAYQQGLTISLNYHHKYFDFQPFITFQHTDLKDFSPYFSDKTLNPTKNKEALFDVEHQTTPKFYGGFIFNSQALKRFNINVNAYFLDAHRILANSLSEVANFNTENETGAKIAQTFILNAKLGYKLNPKLTIFGNVRNLFANNYQHYFTDVIQTSYLCGFNFDM